MHSPGDLDSAFCAFLKACQLDCKVLQDVTSAPSSKKRAVLAGVNSYGRRALKGCLNDIKVIHSDLVFLGFQTSDIAVFEEHQARSPFLRYVLETCAELSQERDVFAFYYSGHGAEKSDRKKNSGFRESIVPFFGAGYGRDDIDDDWFNAFLAPKFKTKNVTIILDSCHSGGVSRLLRDATAASDTIRMLDHNEEDAAWPLSLDRQATRDLSDVPATPSDNEGTQAGVRMDEWVFLSACHDNEFAVEHDFGSGMQGVFTHFLHIALSRDPPSSLENWNWLRVISEARLSLAKFMEKFTAKKFTQSFKIEGQVYWQVFGTGITALKRTFSARVVEERSGPRMFASVGSIAGLSVEAKWRLCDNDAAFFNTTAVDELRCTIESVSSDSPSLGSMPMAIVCAERFFETPAAVCLLLEDLPSCVELRRAVSESPWMKVAMNADESDYVVRLGSSRESYELVRRDEAGNMFPVLSASASFHDLSKIFLLPLKILAWRHGLLNVTMRSIHSDMIKMQERIKIMIGRNALSTPFRVARREDQRLRVSIVNDPLKDDEPPVVFVSCIYISANGSVEILAHMHKLAPHVASGSPNYGNYSSTETALMRDMKLCISEWSLLDRKGDCYDKLRVIFTAAEEDLHYLWSPSLDFATRKVDAAVKEGVKKQAEWPEEDVDTHKEGRDGEGGVFEENAQQRPIETVGKGLAWRDVPLVIRPMLRETVIARGLMFDEQWLKESDDAELKGLVEDLLSSVHDVPNAFCVSKPANCHGIFLKSTRRPDSALYLILIHGNDASFSENEYETLCTTWWEPDTQHPSTVDLLIQAFPDAHILIPYHDGGVGMCSLGEATAEVQHFVVSNLPKGSEMDDCSLLWISQGSGSSIVQSLLISDDRLRQRTSHAFFFEPAVKWPRFSNLVAILYSYGWGLATYSHSSAMDSLHTLDKAWMGNCSGVTWKRIFSEESGTKCTVPPEGAELSVLSPSCLRDHDVAIPSSNYFNVCRRFLEQERFSQMFNEESIRVPRFVPRLSVVVLSSDLRRVVAGS